MQPVSPQRLASPARPPRNIIPAPGYGYNNGGVVGAIVNSVLGGGGQYGYGTQYGYGAGNDRYAVDQCNRAVSARLGGNYGYGSRL